MPPDSSHPRRFNVALSFPGEHRGYVKQVASHLASTFGRERVLYDKYHDAEFARPNLNVYLPNLYRTQSALIVIFLCPEYAAKEWCKLEWRHIRQLIATADEKRIMFLSFGNPGDLSDLGILGGDGYIDILRLDPQVVAKKIIERFRLNAPNGPSPPRFDLPTTASVRTEVRNLVKGLADVEIEIPQNPIKIIPALRALPRRGKMLRIKKARLNVPVRSVFDHIMSLGHNADCLLADLGYAVGREEVECLARCVVFHDLCEVLVGDVADYTPGETMLGRRRSVEEKKAIEACANRFLGFCLSAKLDTDFKATIECLENPDDSLMKVFRALDVSDPLIAVWRYLHVFRKRHRFDPRVFVEAMRDFFTNHTVRRVCRDSPIKGKMDLLLRQLQDRELAKRYCEKPGRKKPATVLDQIATAAGLDPSHLKQAIEGRTIEFVPSGQGTA